MSVATIEDLAFPNRSSRVPDHVGRRVCLSETSYAAAEKSDEGMALKIWRERGHPGIFSDHDPHKTEENRQI
jgi:hypothetical protein